MSSEPKNKISAPNLGETVAKLVVQPGGPRKRSLYLNVLLCDSIALSGTTHSPYTCSLTYSATTLKKLPYCNQQAEYGSAVPSMQLLPEVHRPQLYISVERAIEATSLSRGVCPALETTPYAVDG